MAHFKYIGDHAEIVMYDLTFRRNDPVDVEGKVLRFKKSVAVSGGRRELRDVVITVESKLAGNPAFEKVEEINVPEDVEFEEVKPKRRGRPPNGNKSRNTKQSLTQA